MTETPEELKVFEAQLQSIREDMIFDLNMDDLTSIKILLDMVEPHVSSDDGSSYIKLTLDLFIKNLELFLSSKSLINQVNKKLGY